MVIVTGTSGAGTPAAGMSKAGALVAGASGIRPLVVGTSGAMALVVGPSGAMAPASGISRTGVLVAETSEVGTSVAGPSDVGPSDFGPVVVGRSEFGTFKYGIAAAGVALGSGFFSWPLNRFLRSPTTSLTFCFTFCLFPPFMFASFRISSDGIFRFRTRALHRSIFSLSGHHNPDSLASASESHEGEIGPARERLNLLMYSRN